jgi:WD40 repeat protein
VGYQDLDGNRFFTPGNRVNLTQGGVVAFSADGRRLISATSSVDVWDIETWQEIGIPPIDLLLSPAGLALRLDGERVVVVDGQGTVKLWDLSPLAEQGGIRAGRR